MLEYEFPSGRATTAFDPTAWSREFQFLYALLVIAAIFVFGWRCFKRVTSADLLGWGSLLVGDILLFDGICQRWPHFQQDMVPFRIWLSAIGWLALTVNIFRWNSGCLVKLVGSVVAWLGLLVVTLPFCSTPRSFAHRTQCKNAMKNIGLAVHNYLDVYGQFPYAG